MIAHTMVDSFIVELLQGVHQPSDDYRMALYDSSAHLGEFTDRYVTDGEVIGSLGYDAGGQSLTGYTAVLLGRVAILDWNDPLWPRSTITARGAMIYNASKNNRVLATMNFGRDIASTNGNFLVVLPEPDAQHALIRIGG